MRRKAKMVNFGIIYGISAFGLSQRLGIPRTEAAQIIESYFRQFPGVASFMKTLVEEARAKGFVQTLCGRRRRIEDIASANATLRAAAERTAINTPIQGSAADMIKLAMIRVDEALKQSGLKARMLLQVHDELLLEVPRDEVVACRKLVAKAMEEAMPLPGVAVEVEIGEGDNWLQAH
jgi:DNA polymerase-1